MSGAQSMALSVSPGVQGQKHPAELHPPPLCFSLHHGQKPCLWVDVMDVLLPQVPTLAVLLEVVAITHSSQNAFLTFFLSPLFSVLFTLFGGLGWITNRNALG